MPVRIAFPNDSKVEGLFEELKDPAFSTVIGLLLYSAGQNTEYEINFQQKLLHSKVIYQDDLSNIKIDHKENPLDSLKEHKEAKQNVEGEKLHENDHIIFDDLPDIENGKSSPLKKIANWAKQLF